MSEKKVLPPAPQSVIGNVIETLGVLLAEFGLVLLLTGGATGGSLLITGLLVVIVAELVHIRYLLDRD